jgi:predicted nucleic acid-binding protein
VGNVLLDTSVVIDLARGRSSAATRLQGVRDAGDLPCTCAVVVLEVWRGRRSDEEPGLETLLRSLRALPITVDAGIRGAEWQAEYRARGVTLEDADVLIAGVAISTGARLATANVRDFPMPGLQLEHWPSR